MGDTKIRGTHLDVTTMLGFRDMALTKRAGAFLNVRVPIPTPDTTTQSMQTGKYSVRLHHA